MWLLTFFVSSNWNKSVPEDTRVLLPTRGFQGRAGAAGPGPMLCHRGPYTVVGQGMCQQHIGQEVALAGPQTPGWYLLGLVNSLNN